jgi:hypothetical protein
MVHRSRWGFHPCDYATFLLLKKLNVLCERARRQFAAWQRWHRKMPHNRVVRRKVVDADGRRIGREVVGQMPEPPLPELFCTVRHVRTYWSQDGRPLKEGRLVEEMCFDDRGIPEAYRSARRPVLSEADVQPLRLDTEEVRRLAGQTT